MDLLNLFMREGPIVGLEISDQAIRISLLEQKSKKASPKIKLLAEEFLVPGDVKGGLITNEESFIKSLKKLIDKTKAKYAVVSIPTDYIYAKVYGFPAEITGEKLKSSIDLIANFQLPKKKEEIYFDWEKINDSSKNEVLLASINRPIADSLAATLEKAGLKTVAIEFHPLSLARVAAKDDQSCLIVEKLERITAIFVIKNQVVRFLYTMPNNSDFSLIQEINKFINFYETEFEPISCLSILGDFKKEEFKDLPLKPIDFKLNQEIEKQFEVKNSWPLLISLGAGLRGLLPRGKDNLISLMKVGTEDAYRKQKIITLADLLSRATIIVSIFFVLTFILVWLLMTNLQKNLNQQINSYAFMPIDNKVAQLESKAATFNRLIKEASDLAKIESRWSILLNELNLRITKGVTLTNLSITSINQPITIAGTAQSRLELNLFKESLDQSELFKDVILPLENLGKKDNIPFSISLNLKNINSIFIK